MVGVGNRPGSGEDILDLVEKPLLLLRHDGAAERLGQLLEQPLLVMREVCRGHHPHADALIAATAAATVAAGVGDHPTLAVAAVALGHVHELAEDALLHTTHLAAAVAARTALGLAARLGARAAAHRALLGARDLDLLFGAEHG